MKLGPRLDETALSRRKRTGDYFDRLISVDGDLILAISMKMWSAMTGADLTIHAYDDTVKTGKFGHALLWQASRPPI